MFILILCSKIPFSKNSYHIETSQPITKTNELTRFYMIQVFAKKYSQTDHSILLKILYLAPGSSKKNCTKMGFFVQSQIYRLQLCNIVQVCFFFFFCGFSFSAQSVDSRNYSYKEVDNKSSRITLC